MAFEDLLLRTLRKSDTQASEDVPAASDVQAAPRWRSPAKLVEGLIAELDGLGADRKFALLQQLVVDRVIRGEHVVVFSRMLATAAYLALGLREALEGIDAGVSRLDASVLDSERMAAFEEWHSRPSVLVTTIGAAAALDLRDASVGIVYDNVASIEGFDRIWGTIDRPGRTTTPTLALVLPSEASLLAAERSAGMGQDDLV
jgi:hypothetical protein